MLPPPRAKGRRNSGRLFPYSHVGLRAGYYYIRNTENITLGGFSITNAHLIFSWGTVGVVFRF